MRNPFKDNILDNCCIKINYNKVHSRTNSINSERSKQRSNDPYQINKFQQIKAVFQYKTNTQLKKYIEKESLKVYGAQSFRLKSSYFQNMDANNTQYFKKFTFQSNSPFLQNKRNTSRQRDSDNLSNLIKNDEFISNADLYTSNVFILDGKSSKSLSISNFNGYNCDNQKNNKNKLSLYGRFKNQYEDCQLKPVQQLQNLSRKSIKRFESQKKFNPTSEDQFSRKNTVKKFQNSNKDIKSIENIRSSKAFNQIKQKQFSDKIRIKGKQFYASPYYQI